MSSEPEVQLLLGALERYSPTGSTSGMGQYLINWCKEHGMEAEISNDMAVMNPKAKALLMLGHMDTVSGEIKVEDKNGDLYGRGAADAKGPLCAALAAVQKHPELWDKICIIAAPDEEGESKTALFLRENWTERPSIILEPSTWRGITLSYMGRLGLECTISCPPSHPGHQKPFAAEELCKAWMALEKEYLVRIKNIEGKDTEAKMNLDVRFREAGADEILSKLPETINVKILEKTLPYFAKKNTKLTRTFLRAIREMDGTPVFKKKTGTSDMNVLGEKWKDAPMLAYGPGDGRLGHTDEEHISIDEYHKSIKVLEKALVHIFE